mmetsp:Transcript_44823/g.103552  ORF Transcript_44823/g.103552 Transcript_44823/m.103552 type:complete len:229 (+) Transcript_44823:764-1450(+)
MSFQCARAWLRQRPPQWYCQCSQLWLLPPPRPGKLQLLELAARHLLQLPAHRSCCHAVLPRFGMQDWGPQRGHDEVRATGSWKSRGATPQQSWHWHTPARAVPAQAAHWPAGPRPGVPGSCVRAHKSVAASGQPSAAISSPCPLSPLPAVLCALVAFAAPPTPRDPRPAAASAARRPGQGVGAPSSARRARHQTQGATPVFQTPPRATASGAHAPGRAQSVLLAPANS